MSDLETHFSKLLNTAPKNIADSKMAQLKSDLLEFINATLDSNSDLLPGTYNSDFLIKIAKTLKNGKSAFLDGATNEVLKHSMFELSTVYSILFNHIELSGEFPEQWKSSFLVPLHKKGSRGDPDNYRGLAVGSNIGKFFTKCLNHKLKSFVEENNILSPHQFGFRDDFRTTDAIFSLRSVVNYYKSNGNKPVYACFVDFSKAFDSISRIAMAYKLGTVGIKGSMLKLINNMYSHSEYIIKSGGDFSQPINSTLGVKQGCNLSPLLFNIFINDIHDIFDSSCDPISLNNHTINSLSFADDLVILSESPTGLNRSLQCLDKYCDDWGLKVNSKKTKVMVFNRAYTKKIQNSKYFIHGEIIQTTKSYCYLGIEMSNTGSFYKATDALYNKSLRALFSLYSALSIHTDQTNSKLYLKLFDALIKPILLYGCEVWGTHISQPNNTISKFVNKFYRILLGVPRHTSTAGIHMELGRFPIDTNVHEAMLKYWFRLISLPASRLVSHCYWSIFNNPNVTDPWLNSIKNIIFNTGQCHLWSNQKDFVSLGQKFSQKHVAYLSQNLKDQSIQLLSSKINEENKLHFFKNAKETLSISNHLTKIKSRESRSLISKLRLGVLPLEIERGRRKNVPKEQRFCKLCNSEQVENEPHFIFDCPALENYRSPFITDLSLNVPFFHNLNSSQKLQFLFFNELTPNHALETAAKLIVDLFNARKLLLNP